MDRLSFFKHGLSSLLDAASSVIGLKKAYDSFTEAVDEAISDIAPEVVLHLPTLDNDMYEGAEHTLGELKQMGFTAVELGKYSNGEFHFLPLQKLKAYTEKAGLKVVAAHIAIEDLLEQSLSAQQGAQQGAENNSTQEARQEAQQGAQQKAQQEAQQGAQQGVEEDRLKIYEPLQSYWLQALHDIKYLAGKYIIIPKLPEVEPTDRKAIEHYAQQLELLAEESIKQGVKLCYHPTANELRGSETQPSIMSQIAELTDQSKLSFEIDTYEALRADIGAITLLQEYGKRVKLLHLHDLANLGESGEIDFDEIVEQGSKSGVEQIIVEVTTFHLPPKNCVERSLSTLLNYPSVRY